MVHLPIPTFGQALYRGEPLPGVRELVSTASMADYDLYQRNFPVSHRQQVQRPGTPSSMASEWSSNLSTIGSRSGETESAKEIAAEQKNANARATRKTEKDIRCYNEDMLYIYIGYEPAKPQSASNGRAAGLMGDKRDNALGSTALLESFLRRELLEVRAKDQNQMPGSTLGDGPNFPACQAEKRKIIDDAKVRGSILPGTLLDGGDEPQCDYDKKSKACNQHGGNDCRISRRNRRKRAFDTNLRRHERASEQWGSRVHNVRESRLA
ncbi:hypothetical protein LTR74_016270 [Friedmanniomyces endolithicus]|nr:hypothetical protein LTR74_016270 [Friedmanniomyces endolithicus]